MVRKTFFLVTLITVIFLAFFSLQAVYAQPVDQSTVDQQFLNLFQKLTPGGSGLPGVPGNEGTSRDVGKLVNPVGFKSLGALIAAILDIIVQIAVPIAALFLIYSGFLFVTAQGDETKLGTAKSIFLWTMVGIAVLLGAKILASVIEGTINQFKR